jgi:hypothetical protein
LHHGDSDRPGRTRAYRLEQPGIAKGGGIAALLQYEALLADAARGVDGQHELQIDGPLRTGWRSAEDHCAQEQRYPDPAREAHNGAGPALDVPCRGSADHSA